MAVTKYHASNQQCALRDVKATSRMMFGQFSVWQFYTLALMLWIWYIWRCRFRLFEIYKHTCYLFLSPSRFSNMYAWSLKELEVLLEKHTSNIKNNGTMWRHSVICLSASRSKMDSRWNSWRYPDSRMLGSLTLPMPTVSGNTSTAAGWT